jgi:integrase
LLLTYYHGLRVAEVTGLQWHDVDWTTEQIHVRRVKRGTPATHPLRGDTLRALRTLKREAENSAGHMFISERGGPLSPDMVARIVLRAGVIAGIGFRVHPHMLRHGCGFALANKGTDTRTIQAYLGHSQISSTVRYTALSAKRFENLFRD